MTTGSPILNWLYQLDPRIWQAVIAGAFVSLGWVFNGWQNRRDARELRHEKLRDVHRALFAEIDTNLANLGNAETLAEHLEQIIKRMTDDPTFIPFVPKERNDRLFDTIKAEIHILPRVTIDPVVRYYSQLDALDALTQDLRGEEFRALELDRRIAMYTDYISMRDQAATYGRLANYLIKTYGEKGKGAAETARDTFRPSNSAVDRSGL